MVVGMSVHGSHCVSFIVNDVTNVADVCASYNISEEEARANAAHIVRCVNSHDELVKIAHGARAVIEEWYEILRREGCRSAAIDGPPLIAAIDAALAKARP